MTIDTTRTNRYGRARLWLGISAVGTLVTLATIALIANIPERLGGRIDPNFPAQLRLLLAFIVAYAAIHVPFDMLGGYILPKRFGRQHASLPRFIATLARGIAVQAVLFLATGAALLAAAQLSGRWSLAAVIGVAITASLILLRLRPTLARITATLRSAESVAPNQQQTTAQLPTQALESDDEGFTGGISGVFAPNRSLVPARWQQQLGNDGMQLAQRRRNLVVTSGGWKRGRWIALAFTWTGIIASATLVGAQQLTTAAGIIELSLFFTLWSFLGLLVLPTFSRAGVNEVDERLREEGIDPTLLSQSVQQLDALQDDEPKRPTFVETIFHPIPSVERRLQGPWAHNKPGYWDAARSAIFLSAAGLGLLGRAVHCNCGRPALWVFLPSD